MIVFLLFLFLTFCNCIDSIADSFYIFDVGQGNCQLAIFEKEGIGILYDCGSSNLGKPVKFIPKIEENKWRAIYQKKEELDDNIAKAFPSQNWNIDEDSKEDGSQSESSNSMSNSVITLMSLSIRDYLTKLKHLFIILSHPDKDHINLINADNIPDNIPITVLCEGDWFGQKNGLTESVCDVLNFLKTRKNTWIDFPFYWEGSQSVCEKIHYKDILQTFEKDNDTFLKTLALCKDKAIIPVNKCFSLQETLQEIIKRNPDKERIVKHFHTIKPLQDYSFMDKTIYPVVIFSELFKNIKIAHINFPFKDVNSQSAIVGLKMPKLKMQFFLTGDASEETFALLPLYDKDFFKKEEGYTSLVMLPHHGSIENKSIHLFNLFRPDILGISAGNGRQFAHPSKDLINWIEENYKESSFFDRFSTTMNGNYLVNYEKRQQPFLKKISDKKQTLPLLCTNYLGAVKINENGVFSQFSNVIECENKNYLIDFRKKEIISDDKIESNRDNVLLEKDCKIYFPVRYENKIYLYVTTELKND